MYPEILEKIEKYLAGELSRHELRNAVAGVVETGDKQADDLAAQVFSGFIFVEAGDMTSDELDAELRETVAQARRAA